MSADETMEQRFTRLLGIRREMLGAEYVDSRMASTDPNALAVQRIATNNAWGTWDTDALSRREHRLVVIAMVAAQHHWPEVELHLRAAMADGMDDETVVAVIHKVAGYCGVPAALGIARAFDAAKKSLGR